ncbi:hypothetical protein GE061_012580 [Apolygus lucorum]|uniref:Uncharacterized protein n=1 Tax=Apolygus lucorum TaxID=248454 RepID=A0A8S9XSQ1_APOLU|nr:hypothetical protein GE061_012580 [Apolygus lucorum]
MIHYYKSTQLLLPFWLLGNCYLREMSTMLGTVLLGLCVMGIFQADAEDDIIPKIPTLTFYHTRQSTPQLLQLYREAMSEAGLDIQGTQLQVIREKVVDRVSFFKVYYTNQVGMNCYILFKVVMFKGMKMKSYVCLNTHQANSGVEDIYQHVGSKHS